MSRRVEAALDRQIDALMDRLVAQDTIIAVLSEQNQRLIAAALAPSNPAGAQILRIRPKVDDESKAPVQRGVGM